VFLHTSFRTKLFVASVSAAAVSLLVVSVLLSYQVRERQREAIEQRLTDEARLIADLLSSGSALDPAALDREADRLGQYSASRVTLIAEDGRVVGDSTQTPGQLLTLENHSTRPEIIAARDSGLGVSQRFSTTVNTDMLYVATRASHPVVNYVRVALPLTEIDAQLTAIRNLTVVALAFAVPAALVLAWVLSARLGRRATHTLCLLCGAAGLLSVAFIHDQHLLLLSMTGVGIAWASILSLPYAILAGSLPPGRTGVYMGIFNFFIVIPEIVASLGFGWVMLHVLDNDRMAAVVAGGVFLALAAVLMQRVQDPVAGRRRDAVLEAAV